MARALTSMVLDLTLNEARAARFGGFNWYGAEANLTWLRLSSGRPVVYDTTLRQHFGDRVELRRSSGWFGSGAYPTGAGNARYFAGYLRTVPEVKQWAAIELLYSAPPGTTVRFLLGTAAGQVLHWTGAAWAVTDPAVAGNWNTEAEVVAGFPSWSGTSVRVLFYLRTDDGTVTPTVYGARAMARIWAPSPIEDLIFRTVLPHLRSVRVPVRLREDSDGTNTIDLSEIREYRLADLTPVAVHNLTDDPGQTTNLMTGWNAGTSTITLSAVQTAGDDLLVDALVAPVVARQTHPDFTELDRLPAIVLQSVREWDYPASATTDVVRNRSALTALAVGHPLEVTLRFSVLLIAAYDVDVHRLCDATDGVAGFASSEVTGEPVSLRRLTDWESRDGALSVRSDWEAVGMLAYAGQDVSERLIGEIEAEVEEAAT